MILLIEFFIIRGLTKLIGARFERLLFSVQFDQKFLLFNENSTLSKRLDKTLNKLPIVLEKNFQILINKSKVTYFYLLQFRFV